MTTTITRPATLHLHGGANRTTVMTRAVVDGAATTGDAHVELATHGDAVHVRTRWFDRYLRLPRPSRLMLDRARSWTVHVEGSMSRSRIDLAQTTVERLHIRGSVSRSTLVLPTPTGVVPLDVEGSVSDLRVVAPPDVQVDVSVGRPKVEGGSRGVDGPGRYALRVRGAASALEVLDTGPADDASTPVRRLRDRTAEAVAALAGHQALFVLTQAVLAGHLLTGQPFARVVHRTLGTTVIPWGALLLTIVAAVDWYRRRPSPAIFVLALLSFPASVLQLGYGFHGRLAVHVPLGVGLLATQLVIVGLAISSRR